MELSYYSDEELVEGILHNNKQVLEYFFYKKCTPLFAHIIQNVFNYRIDKNELVSELYLCLSDNNWSKIRQFDFRSHLLTWTSVVAVRFFQKRRNELIEYSNTNTLYNQRDNEYNPTLPIEQKMDIRNALDRMTNERYRKVIENLDLNEVLPQILAIEMNTTIDNLYNIHRRARLQLALIMKRKEDFYD